MTTMRSATSSQKALSSAYPTAGWGQDPTPVQRRYDKTTPQAIQAYDAEQAPLIQKVLSHPDYQATKLDVPTYQRFVAGRLKGLTNRAKIAHRTSYDLLPSILESGRLKSQFETNHTVGAWLNTPLRAEVERHLWGIPLGANPKRNRPIYGYLYHSDSPQTSGVDIHGDTSLVFKPHVRDRSTFTWGDSLNAGVVPTRFDDITHRAYNFHEDEGGDALKNARSLSSQPYGYVEAQVHGGVGLNDIHHVVFHGRQPDNAMESLLRLHGLAWQNGFDGRLKKSMTFNDSNELNHHDYKIIGQSECGSRYIVAHKDEHHTHDDAICHVVDIGQRKVFGPVKIQSILKQGYWRPYDGDQEMIGSLLATVYAREDKHGR